MTLPEIETHPFKPFIPKETRILILGTFPPSSNRWSMHFYYPNWINDMWRIMGLIFYGNKDKFCDIANKSFYLDNIKEFLTTNNIALYDTGRTIRRLKGNASDKYLEILTTIDIKRFLSENILCQAIVTTGEKAATIISDLTDSNVPKLGTSVKFDFEGRTIQHFRMPSTSRAYPLPLAKKAEHYSNMLEQCGYSVFNKKV